VGFGNAEQMGSGLLVNSKCFVCTVCMCACMQGGEATKMEEGEYFAIETFGSTGMVLKCQQCTKNA